MTYNNTIPEPTMTSLDPRWLTSSVLDIAAAVVAAPAAQHGIVDPLRSKTTLPILADALMDAGCDDDDLIAWLRACAVESDLLYTMRGPDAATLLLGHCYRESRGFLDFLRRTGQIPSPS